MFQKNLTKQAKSHNRKSQTREATLERLERREVFATAITAFVQLGSLHINGSDGNDQIEIRFVNNQIEVPGVLIKNAQGQLVSQINRSAISGKIFANGMLGNDRIAVVEAGNLALQVVFNGNEGNDTLIGGTANDQLIGGAGNDILTGGGGNDSLSGGDGQDRVKESNLYDAIARNQQLVVSRKPAVVDEFGDINWDRETDSLTGIESVELVAQVSAIDGVVLDASQFSGSVVLRGSNATDYLLGGSGNDELFGNGGNDLLSGGHGTDRLDGGVGSDRIREQGLYDGRVTNQQLVLAHQPAVLDEFGDIIWKHVTDAFAGIESVELVAQASAADGVVLDASLFSGSVVLRGSNGADRLLGGTGDDSLFGGSGNDYLSGAGGHDSIFGDLGDDSLIGGQGNDLIDGGAGLDQLIESNLSSARLANSALSAVRAGTTGVETDTLRGIETSTLNGGVSAAGTTLLDASSFSGPVTLVGTTGRDTLIGGNGNDKLYGLAGDDTLTGNNGNDLLDGGTGTDTISESELVNAELTYSRLASSGNLVSVRNRIAGVQTDIVKNVDAAVLYGGENGLGMTVLNASRFSGNVKLVGTSGKDYLTGGPGNDVLMGNAGDDVLIGNSGNDSLWGELGNDEILGGTGDDLIQGGNGSDFLDGEEGNDFIMGGPDNDRLVSGTGTDTIDGGDGINLFIAKSVDFTRQLNTNSLNLNSKGIDVGVKVPTNASDSASNDTKDEATWKQIVKVLGAELKTYESWKSVVERLDRGEKVSAAEIGGQIGVSVAIAINKIFPTTQPFAKLMEDVARQRGQYYGDMFSDVLDILKGQEKGTVAETVAKLAAAAISVYAIDSAKLDLVRYFGANGWEAFKSVAADIARADVDQAIKDIAQAAGEFIDEIKKKPKDVWNGLQDAFNAIF